MGECFIVSIRCRHLTIIKVSEASCFHKVSLCLAARLYVSIEVKNSTSRFWGSVISDSNCNVLTPFDFLGMELLSAVCFYSLLRVFFKVFGFWKQGLLKAI